MACDARLDEARTRRRGPSRGGRRRSTDTRKEVVFLASLLKDDLSQPKSPPLLVCLHVQSLG